MHNSISYFDNRGVYNKVSHNMCPDIQNDTILEEHATVIISTSSDQPVDFDFTARIISGDNLE